MDIFKKKALVLIFGDPLQLAILLLIATALGFAIAWTYKKTHKGFSYSQSFSVSIILMTVVTALIITLIQDSIARAIGIFGAFSIIRFRTAVKDVRDIAFIFFALATGLAVGVKSFASGVVGVIIVCGLVFVLYRTNFGGLRRFEYVLSFRMESKHHSGNLFKDLFDRYTKTQSLLNVDAKDKGAFLFFTFHVKLRDEEKLNEFIAEMNKVNGVSDVNIVSSDNDLEF
ncbi:MAG: hypothetical protein US89_C0008G0010 [Candidatus Peregrinibacteria bacterium GW2011_GWF2_38_29]|nr:MAG: hypothetical protein US89_C0008G0010 [Candidatus Peregrinibacteria bacterium GW2011_GWF2_38_29]HBB03178.1 hypothetical protein [Candidatus Peregrinibacteria bacterium]